MFSELVVLTDRQLTVGENASLTIGLPAVGTAELNTSDILEDKGGNGIKLKEESSRVEEVVPCFIDFVLAMAEIPDGRMGVLLAAPGIIKVVLEGIVVFHFLVSDADKGMPLPPTHPVADMFKPLKPYGHQTGSAVVGSASMISVTMEPR